VGFPHQNRRLSGHLDNPSYILETAPHSAPPDPKPSPHLPGLFRLMLSLLEATESPRNEGL